MKQRVERIAQIVRGVVASELIKLMPQAHVSISHVEVSDDLRYATLWISSFSQSRRSLEDLLSEVESHRSELNQALVSRLETKFTPVLRFRTDSGKKHAENVDKLLDSL